MSKKVHFNSTGHRVPACCGTGAGRRFVCTADASRLTCSKCQKIAANTLARVVTA